MTGTIRVVQVSRLDGPEAVELVEVPAPHPGDRGVLVDVHVAGVTFPDVLMSRGEYKMKPQLPFVPGSEVAGVGVDTGERVVGICVLGGLAEQVVVDESMLFTLPDNIGFEAGAALPMNYLTVEFALQRRAALQSEQTLRRYRLEYNTVRPHEALAWNRPHDVHLGLASPTIPPFQTT